jgi:hypothetical protein
LLRTLKRPWIQAQSLRIHTKIFKRISHHSGICFKIKLVQDLDEGTGENENWQRIMNSIILFEISIITGKKEIFITKNIIVM